ncbi:transcriptional regulator PpsR [Sandaracinobacteroides saxicola]|uniref:Transcriptional regulator PpsR n=1 Tax=Sandaracinobacteroides saxicola TaxID=2759707 RepID=A0A7G5IKU2_9SPHN|nr:transcriptional regulator PpsR [Sandaracinobacteroides saxicola]QMW23984.1 transcriptional regulator PpsR [Sandaracinobacteroides saxicola]
MNAPLPGDAPVPFRALHETLGVLGTEAAATVLAAAGDMTLVIDQDGVIRDVALGASGMPAAWAEEWMDRPWTETVTVESRVKISEMLRDAQAEISPRWRQITHRSDANGELPMRYLATGAGHDGRVIAIGRDMRAEAAIQQRLLRVQQAMERDYVRLRHSELRYRLLFERAGEAVLIIDAASRRVMEANPAAQRLLAPGGAALTGNSLPALFGDSARDTLLTWLGAVQAGSSAPLTLHLPAGGDVQLAASLFRQERGNFVLIQMHAAEIRPRGDDGAGLLALLERMPDAFVVAGEGMEIATANSAFLDLVAVARREDVLGAPLGRFLGRPGIDLGLLTSEVRDHGVVKGFATVLRSIAGESHEVEVSAVAVESPVACMGFALRTVRARVDETPAGDTALSRSVEQLTGLVGRVPLKDIVRESSDLIERLCIEAALRHSGDNRAGAAEILGLSRQSLYSKLHRHGLGNLGGDED